MNSRTRATRQILRDRARSNRAAAKIRRRGEGTLATHALAAGLTLKEARSVAGSLRKNATKVGVTGNSGRTHAGRRMVDCVRYTTQQVARIALSYRPRRSEYKQARQHLLAA